MLKKVSSTPLHVYIDVFECIFTSAIVRLVIYFLPLKKFAAHLGTEVKKEELPPSAASSINVANAVSRSARVIPWRFKCYEQAFTAKVMLRRRKIGTLLFFGVRKDPVTRNIEAHAWLKAADRIVTGAKGSKSFEIIAIFE